MGITITTSRCLFLKHQGKEMSSITLWSILEGNLASSMSLNMPSKMIKISLATSSLKTGKLSMIKDTENTYSH